MIAARRTEIAYGRARVQYYLTNDLMISSGYTYEGRSFGTIGTEYQIATSKDMGFSMFAEGMLNDRDNYSALAGLRGIVGLRINHNLSVMVDNFSAK